MRKLTQEELLEEAKITEQYNLETLAQLLKLEETRKVPIRRVYKYVYYSNFSLVCNSNLSYTSIEGPFLRYRSTPKGDTITFVNFDQLPPEISQKPLPGSSLFSLLLVC